MKVLDRDRPKPGACDYCSTEGVPLARCTRRGKFNDGPALYVTYLCPSCRALTKQERAGAA